MGVNCRTLLGGPHIFSQVLGSVHITHLISSDLISIDLISTELNGSECAVKRPSLPWLRPVRHDSATYSILIGRTYCRSVQLTWDEMRWDQMSDINAPSFVQRARSLCCSWLKAVHTACKQVSIRASLNGPLAIRRVPKRSLNVARAVSQYRVVLYRCKLVAIGNRREFCYFYLATLCRRGVCYGPVSIGLSLTKWVFCRNGWIIIQQVFITRLSSASTL